MKIYLTKHILDFMIFLRKRKKIIVDKYLQIMIKKKSKKEIKKEIAETQKAYKNLYTIFDLDGSQNIIKNDNLNIIKIKLFEQ